MEMDVVPVIVTVSVSPRLLTLESKGLDDVIVTFAPGGDPHTVRLLAVFI